MFIFRIILITAWLWLPSVSYPMAGSSPGAGPDTDSPPKYILIHLDGVSSYYLNREMQAGHLPNLEETFGNHGVIENVLTYFPSKTPTVISSLREGIPAEESSLVSWTGSHRMTGETFTGPNTFLQMMLSHPRIATTNLLYGLPWLDWLAGPALANLPDLLDRYRVLEFYWYPVDTHGHLYGIEHYLNKLKNFDRQFGRMARRVGNDVNIIVYADHGMTFGRGVDTHAEIVTAAGDQITTVSYPNVYVKDPENIQRLARRVQEETPIDFTFFRSSESTVTGFHQNGQIYFHRENAGFSYTCEGEDPFGYYERGYNGEALSAGQWLEFSRGMIYPAVPVQVYNLLRNPGAGDIITLLNRTKYSRTSFSRRGNHGGFTYRDVTVPVLLRGPDLEFLYGRETLWLQNLFHEIQTVSFGNTPARDEHYLDWRHNFSSIGNTVRLTLSPIYRWSLESQVSFADDSGPQRIGAWTKFDLFRSYLSRFWIGAGIESENRSVNPMAFIRYELRYRKVTARTTLSTTGSHIFAVEYRLADPLSLRIVNFNSAGLRVHF